MQKLDLKFTCLNTQNRFWFFVLTLIITFFINWTVLLNNLYNLYNVKFPPSGKICESAKIFKNNDLLTEALSCKVQFIYSARKIVHSEEYCIYKCTQKWQKSKVPKKQKKWKINEKRIQWWYIKQYTGIHSIQRGFGFA